MVTIIIGIVLLVIMIPEVFRMMATGMDEQSVIKMMIMVGGLLIISALDLFKADNENAAVSHEDKPINIFVFMVMVGLTALGLVVFSK